MLSRQHIERDRGEHRAGGEVLHPARQPGARRADSEKHRSDDRPKYGEDDQQAGRTELGAGHP